MHVTAIDGPAFLREIVGKDPDDFVGEVVDVEWEAPRHLAELVPTTLVAKVDYFGKLANEEADRGMFDDCDTMRAIVLSLAGASSLLPVV